MLPKIDVPYLWIRPVCLRATLDHHRPSLHSGNYTASIDCCRKTFYCIDNKITKLLIAKTQLLHMLYFIDWLMILDTNGWVGVWLLPWLWHILSILLMWIGRSVSFWWPLLPSRNSVLIYMYIFVCILYASSGYMTYIHTHEVSFSSGEAATHHSP